MSAAITRRAFLASAAVLPAWRVATRQAAGELPASADVVVIGGDPAGLAALHHLAAVPGLRVLLLHDAPRWIPAVPAPASVASLPPFVRGHAVCFDTWRDRGCRGWSYTDVLPSFKRLERYEAGASAHRGADGPLAVSHCWDPHPGHRAFLQACVSGGFHQD
jgi:choline dehydrogenase-like flavoprotein